MGRDAGGPRRPEKTGTTIRWLPDLEVFTDIDIPAEYFFTDVLHRQAVVNAGIAFFLVPGPGGEGLLPRPSLPTKTASDYLAELAGDDPPPPGPVLVRRSGPGRDRADKPEYKVKLSAACCFSNKVQHH